MYIVHANNIASTWGVPHERCLKRRAVITGALLFQLQLVFVLFYERINRLRLLLKLST